MTPLVDQVNSKLHTLLTELKKMGVIETFHVSAGKDMDLCDDLQEALLKISTSLDSCVTECQGSQRRPAELRNVITKLVRKKNSLSEAQEDEGESCELCGRQFDTKTALWEHARTEHKAGDWDCRACSKAVKTRAGFARHMRTHNKRTYLCHVCGRTFPRLAEWKNHVWSVHSKQGRFTCATCGLRYATAGRLKIHEARHSLPAWQCHETQTCRRTFTTLKLLRSHRLTHTAKTHSCHLCDKTFVTASRLRFHVKQTHEMPAEELTCLHCGVSFRFKNSLRRHFTEKHMETDKLEAASSFPCDVEGCGKVFAHARSLKKHQQLKHVVRDAMDTCGTCEKTFQSRAQLNRHKLTHKDEQFACEACGKRFTRRDGLRRHEDIVHGKTRGFACSVCAKEFSVKCNRDAHERSVHGSAEVQCEQCGRTCKNASTFRVHLKVHGSRALPCGLCPKRFLRKAHLQAHMQNKHGGVSAFQAVLNSVAMS